MAVLRKYNPATEQWEILQGGVQGLQGPPVSLTKGTVTTTAAGTNADFSITGTPPAQVLNLTLPRGEAGGFVNAVPSGSGSIDSLAPGSYFQANATHGTVANGYPKDGFTGTIVAFTYSSAYRHQLAYPLSGGLSYVRAAANSTTWGQWQRIPHVGQIDLDIVGAGRPDTPASMTTEVAALVAAATSGAKFRSTDGPQGAWEWQKRGSTWWPTAGDTGLVPLVTWDAAGITYTAAGITLTNLTPAAGVSGGIWVQRLPDRGAMFIERAEATGTNPTINYIPAGLMDANGPKFEVSPVSYQGTLWGVATAYPSNSNRRVVIAGPVATNRIPSSSANTYSVVNWSIRLPSWPTTLTP